MILVISPAKALDYETPPTTATFTQPDFLDHAAELITVGVKLVTCGVGLLIGSV